MEPRRRIFVSYSRSDFYFAEQLAVRLRRRGLDVWFDVHELRMGTDWSIAIEQAIADSDAFVLVASRAAMESGYVRGERELATELGKPQAVVVSDRAERPALPTYDLRSSFGRGADRLAHDLDAGHPAGTLPRLRLPIPGSAVLVALAPALAVVFAVALGVLFVRKVVGHQQDLVTDTGAAYFVAVTGIALAGASPAYALWSFLTRRVRWTYLRGALFTMPLIAPFAWLSVDYAASHLTSDPVVSALVGSDELTLGPVPAVLALLVMVASIAAVVATEFAAGVCRYLRTGTVPRRVRSRHVGAVPRPVGDSNVAHSYRLIAADDDARVGDEVRRSLAEVGIDEVQDDRDRDVVVLSDRTPGDWMSRDDLRSPVGLAATSISLPVRGVIQRFQWVDFRARRRETLRALARDLTAAARDGPAPDVPESLQQPRVPLGVAVAEWTLHSMAVLAALVSTYTAALWAFTDRPADLWPSIACVAVAPALVVLGRSVRGRWITPPWLVGAVVLCWAAMIALGLDGVLQAMFPSYDRGSFSAATVIYPVVSAVVLALTWRSLRRWLPDRLRVRRPASRTLGYAHASWPWLSLLVPAVASSAGMAVFAAPLPAVPSPLTVVDVCRDDHDLGAATTPYSPASAAIFTATSETVVAAFQRRIRVTKEVIRELERLEPTTSWGADVRTRLVAGFATMARADQSFIRGEITREQWNAAHDDLAAAVADLDATC